MKSWSDRGGLCVCVCVCACVRACVRACDSGLDMRAENYKTMVQLALLVLDAHVRRCNVLDIDDDECCQLRLSPLEWTLLLGETCPTLGRDREVLASISELGALAGGGGGGGAGGGGAGAGAGGGAVNGAAVFLQQNQAAQLKRQRTVGYAPYGGTQQVTSRVKLSMQARGNPY